MRGQVLIAGVVILILCGGLAAADFLLTERPNIIAQEDTSDTPLSILPSSSSSISSSETVTPSSVASSNPSAMPERSSSAVSSALGVVKKGVSTKKASGINVEDVLAKLQLVKQETNEASFLLLTAPDKTKVKTHVLLRNNDRAFLFSWIESDDVKSIFAGLKKALQEQFSGKVTDLVDETQTPTGGPLVDYLSFVDPALSAERIVFLRVRTRLYELHVAENGDAVLDQLVTELSK